MEENNRTSIWIYIGFAVSLMLNVTGLAGIASGFVTWIEFLQNIIDVYILYIRQPILYFGNLFWPFGTIPTWAADVFVVWSSWFLAVNIQEFRNTNHTFWAGLVKSYKSHGWKKALPPFLLVTFVPPIAVFIMYIRCYPSVLEPQYQRGVALETAKVLGLIGFLFLLILFINWQFTNLG